MKGGAKRERLESQVEGLSERVLFLESALRSVAETFQIRVDTEAPAWLEYNQETGSIMIDSSPCIAPFLAWLTEEDICGHCGGIDCGGDCVGGDGLDDLEGPPDV